MLILFVIYIKTFCQVLSQLIVMLRPPIVLNFNTTHNSTKIKVS